MRGHAVLIGASVLAVCLVSATLQPGAAQLEGSFTAPVGAPLPGLTSQQAAAFAAGVEDFIEVETIEEGLGPVFNGKSCSECHLHPVVGGASPDRDATVVFRIATRRGQVFDPMVEYGGMVLQRRSIKEINADCPIVGEKVPPEATHVSQRITPPLFGLGLVEAIPVETILQRSDPADRDGDGISGMPNRVFNPETKRDEISRFGWKAHVPTLHVFAGDAYVNEMGITNPTFPQENLPQGQPIPAGWDYIPEIGDRLEDDGEGVDKFADFMRFLAPLPRGSFAHGPIAARGAALFERIGCASCHVPTLVTGDNEVAALRRQSVNLYSDLLLHDMGPELADGMEMGLASGSEWRTTPLWGLSSRKFLLHDGRALTIEAAILPHGGEAAAARNRFQKLNKAEQTALLVFLGSL